MYRYIKVTVGLFCTSLVILFVQHHVEFPAYVTDKSHQNLVYYPQLRSQNKKTSKEEYKRYLVNVRLSDHIPINRKIPDSRPDSCPSPRSSKLSVSIVITFYREWPSILFRTVYSVIKRTTNLKQLILVNDASDDSSVELERLLQHITNLFGDFVKVIALHKRHGLVGARLQGVAHATGDVLCFLDSHMEVNTHWMEPLLEILDERPKAVAMSQLDNINSHSFIYEFSKNYRTRYGFDWSMEFFETEFRNDQLKAGDLNLPGVIAVGSAFAIRLSFFRQIGMYDPELKIWGGENFELSFKVWLCGGELVHVTCSRVGHITRSQPYLQKGRLEVEMYNYKRVADVWMDNHASYVYDQYPGMQNLSVGDLEEQKRRRRQCKPFSWFLSNIWPELFTYKRIPTAGYFMLEQQEFPLCLDNQGHLFSNMKRLGIQKCSYAIKTQMFGITKEKRLRTNLQCVFVKKEVMDLVPYIQTCYNKPKDTFEFRKDGTIVHIPTGFCLTLLGNNLLFLHCDNQNISNQNWSLRKST